MSLDFAVRDVIFDCEGQGIRAGPIQFLIWLQNIYIPHGRLDPIFCGIEAEIGHMKADGRVTRCTQKSPIGDALRLRTQHPQDSGLPQVLAGPNNRCAVGRKQRARTAADCHN